MELTTIWFIVIAGLWVGYFVLEGFDFGVGILLRVLGRDEPERRAVITTIGPVWDGNEVWLIVAGGATFAAFPEWYATLFSGFYLPLFAILVALILRGVALEYRGKRDDLVWRSRMDTMITIGSVAPALLWGITFANLVRGVPIDSSHEFVGSLGSLLSPFALLGGVAFTAVFVAHGAIFLALKTTGELRQRANRFASLTGLAAAVLAVGFLAWAHGIRGDLASAVVAGVAAVALLAGLVANRFGREGWAFLGTAVAVALAVVSLFVAMFPDVMPSSLDPAWSLTTTNAASTPYTLKALTIIAGIFTPLVLLYQGWTYWVFRKRITVEPVTVSTVTPPQAGPVS
ncbi:cytochrome d ubiquinol oxidase subunit II [Kribbella orskensis]|uniref:Cytochrome d ubiquinol oxidase subunit II n=1 Tax=Kribbella orskensis TaxID=2512216 RepID=A0ABY2BFZ5_9ACTN|nr:MULTISPECIES: cytochrome d ubiquinol oxidase subunit II [Kribbella]TCN37569.1 cytochrome d ubiquinol oxidase subunit II [Kribbella sp. VKM Ac-2500]TCO18929.1 cytochrome d ubiquinol oxidase subunit II [Kribbella orskensis]